MVGIDPGNRLEAGSNAGKHSRLEQVADAGETPDAIQADSGIDSAEVDDRELVFQASAEGQSQVWADAPGILRKKSHLPLPVAVGPRSVHVLVSLLVQRHRSVDLSDAAGEHGVE